MVFINPNRGEAELEIGGKERKLVVDMNTLAVIEKATGAKFFFDPEDAERREEFERKSDGIDFMRQALAAALSHSNRTVSPEMVGRWLSADMDLAVTSKRAFTSALNSFFAALVEVHRKKHPTAEAPEKEEPEEGPEMPGADGALDGQS
jgi:hypothetical protein